MPDSFQALRQAYLDCTYGPAGGRFRLLAQPDAPPGWATPGRCWAIITAWNPGSQWQAKAENHAAQTRLETEIRAAGWDIHPAWNGEGEWREDSALVWDIPLTIAASLGHRYGQNAVLWGVGRRVALVWMPGVAGRIRAERFWARIMSDLPPPSLRRKEGGAKNFAFTGPQPICIPLNHERLLASLHDRPHTPRTAHRLLPPLYSPAVTLPPSPASPPDAISPLGVLPPAGPQCVHLPLNVTPQELARYAVGLANARGGTVLVGTDLIDKGQTAERDAGELHPLMVTHAIFELSGGRLTVNVQHHRLPGGVRVLAVFVPQAPYVLAAPDGAVIAWDGAQLVPVAPAQSDPVADHDFTAVVPPDASLADLDPAEVMRLRTLGRRIEAANLPDLDFLHELGLLVPSGGALRPTLAAILLAGTPAALRAHVPQAEVCYYHHATADAEFQFREDLLRPIPALLTRLAELIQARNRFTPVQVGLFRIEVWDQDEAVYREALLNALTHRDYTLRDVVHVHHFPDRLDIMNPGGLTGGITPGNILRHQPKRRNPLLAEVLARLGLVERAGVGVDKMFNLMLRHGKEPPEFITYPDAVTLSLHSPGFDADFVRFVARKQEEMQTLSLDMLIVLSLLAREGEATRPHLARALQLPEDRTPRLLRGMEEHGLIVRAGVGRGIAYQLSAEVHSALGQPASIQAAVSPAPPTASEPAPPKPRRPRQPRKTVNDEATPTPDEVRAIALALARENGKVRNVDLCQTCGLNTQQAWKVLRKLVQSGLLVKTGRGTRDAAYTLS